MTRWRRRRSKICRTTCGIREDRCRRVGPSDDDGRQRNTEQLSSKLESNTPLSPPSQHGVVRSDTDPLGAAHTSNLLQHAYRGPRDHTGVLPVLPASLLSTPTKSLFYLKIEYRRVTRACSYFGRTSCRPHTLFKIKVKQPTQASRLSWSHTGSRKSALR